MISVDIQSTEQRVVLAGRGDLVAGDITAALEGIFGDPLYAHGMNVLCDIRDARPDLTPGGIRRIVDYVSRNREAGGGGTTAIAAGRDVDYGMTRIARCTWSHSESN